MDNQNLQMEIDKLRKDLTDLTDEVYANNFTSQRDYNKRVHFNSRLKIPVVTALPTQAVVGEVIFYNAKLYVCTTANNWTAQT